MMSLGHRKRNGNRLSLRWRIRRINKVACLATLLILSFISLGYVLQRDSQASVFGAPGIGVKSLGLGYASSCAIGADNQIHCWGRNDSGGLGDGTTASSSNPVNMISSGALRGKQILEMGTGGSHSCALASDYQVYCWGDGTNGELGNGSTAGSLVPVAIDMSGVLSGKTIRALSVGSASTCVIASDNNAYCWGEGTYGRLGNNDALNNDASSPVAVFTGGVLSGKTINSISTGVGRHTCVIASDNNAYCWGENTFGALGNATTVDSNQPVAVDKNGALSGKTIIEISAGTQITCAIASDRLAYCWGYGGSGKLGNNGTTNYSVPVPVYTSGSSSIDGKLIQSISSGFTHVCVVASDGTAHCWGDGRQGQLGNNGSTASAYPRAVDTSGVLSGKTIKNIRVGDSHTCVIASDYKPYCWGIGENGRLGNGDTSNSAVPVTVTTISASVPVEQSVYRFYQPSSTNVPGSPLAITDTPTFLNSVGDSFRLRLGLTNTANISPDIEMVSSGDNHSCAIASDNWAYCWGLNTNGQLGDNSTTNRETPVAIDRGAIPLGATITQVSTGGSHTCALASDNWVYCWGLNDDGQLGDNTKNQRRTPVALNRGVIPTTATIKQVTSGQDFTCVIASDYKAYCWGKGSSGRLGRGSDIGSLTPVAVVQGATPYGSTFLSISAGSEHVCAIMSNQRAYCWGQASSGQLGHDGWIYKTSPVAVTRGDMPIGLMVRQISTGEQHTCAIASDYKAYCWGKGSSGRLGDGGIRDYKIPIAVGQGAMPSDRLVHHISLGNAHTCAIASDNRPYCWGSNGNGQLGDGSTTNRTTAVAVSQGAMSSGMMMSQVEIGFNFTCGVSSSQKTYCWGYNNTNQLGDNTTTNRNTPVATLKGAMTNNMFSIPIGQLSLELEVAPKGVAPTCSAVSTGWGQLNSTSSIAFGNSPPSHNSSISGFGSDPVVPTTSGFTHLSIVGATAFSNGSIIEPDKTALWDFVLKDNGSASAGAYCLRLVSTAGATNIYDYGVYPEITTAQGEMLVEFVDNDGNTITGNGTDTIFPSKNSMTTTQTSTAELTNNYSKQLQVHNSLSTSGWTVSISATGGSSAKWLSSTSDYGYNLSPNLGRLTLNLDSSSVSAYGTDSNGDACSSETGITRNLTNTPFVDQTTNSITLLSGSSSAGFDCSWRMRNIGLTQTIPASQPPGSYSLDMTLTIVAN